LAHQHQPSKPPKDTSGKGPQEPSSSGAMRPRLMPFSSVTPPPAVGSTVVPEKEVTATSLTLVTRTMMEEITRNRRVSPETPLSVTEICGHDSDDTQQESTLP
jgi:hypothetical protein